MPRFKGTPNPLSVRISGISGHTESLNAAEIIDRKHDFCMIDYP
jgi:hypothetical protein